MYLCVCNCSKLKSIKNKLESIFPMNKKSRKHCNAHATTPTVRDLPLSPLRHKRGPGKRWAMLTFSWMSRLRWYQVQKKKTRGQQRLFCSHSNEETNSSAYDAPNICRLKPTHTTSTYQQATTGHASSSKQKREPSWIYLVVLLLHVPLTQELLLA